MEGEGVGTVMMIQNRIVSDQVGEFVPGLKVGRREREESRKTLRFLS